MDTKKSAKELIGEKLKHYREEIAGIKSREQFAGMVKPPNPKREKSSRGYITEIETGKANPSVDFIEAFLDACNISMDQFLRGFAPVDAKTRNQKYHEMLEAILNSEEEEFIVGIKANLKAMLQMVNSLRGTKPTKKNA